MQNEPQEWHGVAIGVLLLMFALAAWVGAMSEMRAPIRVDHAFWTGMRVIFGSAGLVILSVSLLRIVLRAPGSLAATRADEEEADETWGGIHPARAD